MQIAATLALQVVALHRVQKRHHDPSARGPDGMPQRAGPAVGCSHTAFSAARPNFFFFFFFPCHEGPWARRQKPRSTLPQVPTSPTDQPKGASSSFARAGGGRGNGGCRKEVRALCAWGGHGRELRGADLESHGHGPPAHAPEPAPPPRGIDEELARRDLPVLAEGRSFSVGIFSGRALPGLFVVVTTPRPCANATVNRREPRH